MAIGVLAQALPGYAQELKRALMALAAGDALSERELAGCFIAAAFATRQPQVLTEAANTFARKVPFAVQVAARQAASVATWHAIAARFAQADAATASLSARLSRERANVPPGVEATEYALWMLAAWAVIGGSRDDDLRALAGAGLDQNAAQMAVRIAAVLQAIAVTLDGEATLAPPQPSSI